MDKAGQTRSFTFMGLPDSIRSSFLSLLFFTPSSVNTHPSRFETADTHVKMTLSNAHHQPLGLCPCDETVEPLQKDMDSLNLDKQSQPHDDDSDADSDVPAHEAKTTLEKRHRQNQILKAFAANISANATQEEITEATSKSVHEEQLSIREILAKQESSVRITTPRDYQTELFQRAKKENIIAVLDTGSGKTHIATLLLQHILDEELANRAAGHGHKTAFFLVIFISDPPVPS